MEGKKDFKFFVIGVGLSRTGTSSTRTALNILLPGKCTHMSEVFNDLKTNTKEFYMNDVTDEEFRKYFEKHNYVAGVDLPFIMKYEQAMRVFPDALVLLTVREPEGWVRSMKSTICQLHGEKSIHKSFPYSLYLWTQPALKRFYHYIENTAPLKEALHCVNNATGVEYFSKYTEEIKAKVPNERLLVFNVKEGWEPLCEALGLPIPDQPFPNVNDMEYFKERIVKRRKRTSWMFPLVGVTTSLIIGYSLKRYFKIDSANTIQEYYKQFASFMV